MNLPFYTMTNDSSSTTFISPHLHYSYFYQKLLIFLSENNHISFQNNRIVFEMDNFSWSSWNQFMELFLSFDITMSWVQLFKLHQEIWPRGRLLCQNWCQPGNLYFRQCNPFIWPKAISGSYFCKSFYF